LRPLFLPGVADFPPLRRCLTPLRSCLISHRDDPPQLFLPLRNPDPGRPLDPIGPSVEHPIRNPDLRAAEVRSVFLPSDREGLA
jgi:hypothetical protein